jgi:DNA-binding NtrC family response regulator
MRQQFSMTIPSESMNNQISVLLVDDEEALRFTLSSELTAEGYIVKDAADGDIAIEMVKKEDFDVVLLDIKMPHVDGFEVLKFVKSHRPETKVIMLTAFGDMQNAIQSLKLGASDFASKPYDFHDLLATISRALAK